MITEAILRKAADEFNKVMDLDPKIETTRSLAYLIPLVKQVINGVDSDNIPFIRPSDTFTKEVEEFITNVYSLSEEEILEELKQSSGNDNLTLDDELYTQVFDATSLKELKDIVNSNDEFKSLRGSLGGYSDKNTLRDELYALLNVQEVEKGAEERKESNELKIHHEFLKACPHLSDDEFKALEELIVKDGEIIEPILTWKGYIVDGHHRYEIATKHNIPFTTKEKEFKSDEDVIIWMKENALGQRNLSDYAKFEMLQQIEAILKKEGKARQSSAFVTSNKTEEPHNTRKILAEKSGLSESQIQKAEQVSKLASEEDKEKLRKGEKKIGTVHKELIKKDAKSISDNQKVELAYKELEKWVMKYNSDEVLKQFTDSVTDIIIDMRELIIK